MVVENPLNFYLELHKGEFGMRPVYEPRGHKEGQPTETWWFPKFIAEGFVEKYKANIPSVDPNWPDEMAAAVYKDCKPYEEHLARQKTARTSQHQKRWRYIVSTKLSVEQQNKKEDSG